MTERRFLPKTAADYAAIAVAPALIFLMISALANFLMLLLYSGSFGDRLSWTLLMYTMGTVGIARIAIEQDRAYSLGYAGVLGIAAYVTLLGLVGSPIFCLFILVVIAYLSDVIVRDCTLIDEDVDASGQGLIDSGRIYLRTQVHSEEARGDDADQQQAEKPKTKPRKVHQPGRTVMYLSLAALPMFGIGQFLLRQDEATWARAQWLLAVYLFSGLSLLVTTSFLGLRRYLRQRSVEMPGDVAVGWLAGGLAMIALVLTIAYLAPLPGRVIAAADPPAWLSSPGDREASSWGWGDEGADKNTDGVQAKGGEKPTEGEPPGAADSEDDAPPGDVGSGNRQDGPAGSQSGGNQTGGSESQQDSAAESQSGQSQSSGESSQDSSQSQNASSESSSSESSSSQQSGSSESSSSESNAAEAAPESSDRSSGGEPTGDEQSESSDTQSADDSQSQSAESQPEQSQPEQSQPSESQASESQSSESSSSSQQPSSSPASQPSLGQTLSSIFGFIKLLITLILAAIVIGFLWLNRDWILRWLQQLFEREEAEPQAADGPTVDLVPPSPPRPFASFSNPIGKENDPRRVVVITFQALDAWMRERNLPRHKDETPAEFLRRVKPLAQDLSPATAEIVDAYNRIVYGRGRASQRDVRSASEVWNMMDRPV